MRERVCPVPRVSNSELSLNRKSDVKAQGIG